MFRFRVQGFSVLDVKVSSQKPGGPDYLNNGCPKSQTLSPESFCVPKTLLFASLDPWERGLCDI